MVHVFKEGKNVVSQNLSGWREYMGIASVIRKHPVVREEIPSLGWAENNQEEYENLKKALADIQKRKAAKPLTEFWYERETELLQQEKTLNQKRSRLGKWETEQVLRCLNGYDTLVGPHYFYHQFGWIQEVGQDTRSKATLTRSIRPSYRAADDWCFRLLLTAEEEHSGLVGPKRRRFGFTWILVAYCLYVLLFSDATIFLVSKEDDDNEKFLQRLMFMHRLLPPFLQRPMIRDALDLKIFAPSEFLCKIREVDFATSSNGLIRVGSPKNPGAIAGETCTHFIIDEAGEIINLRQVISKGEPMLAASNGIDRAGIMIIGGTVGEMEKAGGVLKKVDNAAEALGLRRMFIDGTMGTYMDECGNDLPEIAREKITRKLTLLEEAGLLDEAAEHRQKYPLTYKDAYQMRTGEKIWPVEIISAAEDDHEKRNPKTEYGLFIRREDGSVGFVRSQPAKGKTDPENFRDLPGYGQVAILEMPVPNDWEYPYTMGVDPVDVDKDQHGESSGNYLNSDFAFAVWKRLEHVGGFTDLPVCMYCGRPDDLNDAFEQAVLAAEFYGALINIERQKGGRFNGYMTGIHKEHLLAYGSGVLLGLENASTWGFSSSEKWWNMMISSGKQWWKKALGKPMFLRFIQESYYLKEKNTDLLVAVLAAKQLSDELDIRETARGGRRVKKMNQPAKQLWRKQNGIFVPMGAVSPGMREYIERKQR